jgi:hypothetical protein
MKQLAVLAFLVVTAAACGSEPAEPPAAGGATGAAAPAAAPASTPPATSAASGPRVFFVEPQDGATVKSPVTLKFGLENYELAAVPQGTVETARPNMGHHHVGVDTECLPPGTEIPKANPWVHHGNAATEMTMQLTPGPHKLTLQIGDDKHVTIPGLCQTITVNVAQ